MSPNVTFDPGPEGMLHRSFLRHMAALVATAGTERDDLLRTFANGVDLVPSIVDHLSALTDEHVRRARTGPHDPRAALLHGHLLLLRQLVPTSATDLRRSLHRQIERAEAALLDLRSIR